MAARRSILIKTIQLGAATLLSRVFGFFRELLMVRYLGVGVISDAYNTAFTLPNTLRKIFAEGALNAVLSPMLVKLLHEHKGDKRQASALITITLIALLLVLGLLCVLVMFQAPRIIGLLAPGFSNEQRSIAAQLSRILIFFIIAVSLSAVFSSALQAVYRLFMPSYGQVILNIFIILAAGLGLAGMITLEQFSGLLVISAGLLAGMYGYSYLRAGFFFALPDSATLKLFNQVLRRFLPCFVAVGSLELTLIIDRMMASYLPEGSISLLSYAYTFLRVPLGVFAGAFATILLPYFSKIGLYAPKRLNYYLLEATKLVAWITIPATIVMMLLGYQLFFMLWSSGSGSMVSHEYIIIASQLLTLFSIGLFFLSLNKILLNLFYALHNTFIPTVISLLTTALNTVLNYFFMNYWGVLGIAVATSCAAIVQTGLLLYMLNKHFCLTLSSKRIVLFARRAFVQLLVTAIIAGILLGMGWFLSMFFSERVQAFLARGIGFWLWVGPVCVILSAFMYITRRYFGIRIYFLD